MDGAAHGEERPIERAAVERDAAVEPRDLLPELGEHRLLVATDVFEKAVRRGAARALAGRFEPDDAFRALGILHADHDDPAGIRRKRPALLPSQKIFMVFRVAREFLAEHRVDLCLLYTSDA